MSWLLRRWLNPSTEEKPTPVPTPTSTPTPTLPATLPTTPVAEKQQIQKPTQPQAAQPQTPPEPRLIPNNVKLLLGGLVFFSISTLVTRRTLIRKHVAAIPRFYTSSVYQKPNINGAMDAFEALNIATINTFAAAMIISGATLVAFDIDSVDDARNRLRKKLGYVEGENGQMVPPPTTREEEEQFERDMEAWLANVLDKKDIMKVREKVEAAKLAAQSKEDQQEEK